MAQEPQLPILYSCNQVVDYKIDFLFLLFFLPLLNTVQLPCVRAYTVTVQAP